MEDDDVAFEVSRHLPNLGVTLDEWERDFEEAAAIGAGWDAHNWRTMTERQLERNRRDADRCQCSAVRLLAAARVLGCCARRGSHQAEASCFPKFLDLPPELRLSILHELDNDKILSERQCSSIISFAFDPTTIGYGAQDFSWDHILGSSKRAEADEASTGSSTLPAAKWSWAECFAERAPPRDWGADLLDAGRRLRTIRNGTTGRERECTDPSLYAFLESTMTHQAEW